MMMATCVETATNHVKTPFKRACLEKLGKLGKLGTVRVFPTPVLHAEIAEASQSTLRTPNELINLSREHPVFDGAAAARARVWGRQVG